MVWFFPAIFAAMGSGAGAAGGAAAAGGGALASGIASAAPMAAGAGTIGAGTATAGLSSAAGLGAAGGTAAGAGSGALANIGGALGNIGNGIRTTGGAIAQGARTGATNIGNGISNGFNSAKNGLTSFRNNLAQSFMNQGGTTPSSESSGGIGLSGTLGGSNKMMPGVIDWAKTTGIPALKTYSSELAKDGGKQMIMNMLQPQAPAQPYIDNILAQQPQYNRNGYIQNEFNRRHYIGR